MRKNVFFFWLFLLFAFSVKAQEFTVKGTVLDEENQPLSSATVFTQTVSDSTLINYTVTGTSGGFELDFKTKQKSVRLVITYNGYETYRKEITLDKATLDAGSIKLTPIAFELEGVSVTAEAPPITIKADTLEFNATSFKVAPDANVEALLRQLPGVDIAADGTLTVNGKTVNNILVNGKPFFGSDGKVAMQNLPAELIEKIQVSDTKTKQEQLAGDSASSEEKTINLTIRKEKNKGLFGKATGGYGTDDRYESGLLFNTFKGDRKFSVLGSSNNINSVGFSMDEIFDNMGGGRNQYGSNSVFNRSNSGITQSNMIGFNYADNFWKEALEPSATYYFTETNTDNVRKSETQNLQPNNKTTTLEDYVTDNYSRAHNISTDIEMKIDSTFSIFLNPSFVSNYNENHSTQSQQTFSEEGNLLNESNNSSLQDRQTNNFSNNLFMFKNLSKNGRGISFNFENQNNKSETDLNTQSETYFYETGDPADIRNQKRFDNVKENNYRLGVGYREPIFDSLRLGVNVDYRFNKNVTSRETYNFNDVDNSYSILNDEQSNLYNSQTNTFTPELSLDVRKSKIRAGVDAGADFVAFNNNALYLGEKVVLNKDYVFPNLRGYLNLRMDKSKSFRINYNYNVSLPSAQQILPVINLANPLNTVVGNEELDPTQRHNVYFNYNNFDWSTRTGFFLYSRLTYYQNQIVSSTVFDASNKRSTTYQNLDDLYSVNFGTNYSREFKEGAKSFQYRLGVNVNYDKSKGLTNAELYESSGWQINPNVSLRYEIQDVFSIEPSYRFNYVNTAYDNYVIDKSSNFTHNARLETTLYWPKHLVWGNDIAYNYNSNIADGFQKDFYLWNTSLGYNFFNEKLLAKVKVYDILNQNLSATRTITPTAIEDEQNTVLKQYVMFSLTYKLERFAGGKGSGAGGGNNGPRRYGR